MLKANNIKPKGEWIKGSIFLTRTVPLFQTVCDGFPSNGSPLRILIILECVLFVFPL